MPKLVKKTLARGKRKPKPVVRFKAPPRGKSLREAVYSVQKGIVADIKAIRKLWAEGCTDRDVRDKLKLDWRMWKRRIRLMKAIPPDEDIVSSYRRYFYEHCKAMEKMQHRLERLHAIHDKASEEINIYGTDRMQGKKGKRAPVILYTKPRDLNLAASTAKDMAVLDREMLKMESDLVTVKQKLGMIEEPSPEGFDPYSDAAVVITAPNLVRAWQIRRVRIEQRKFEDAKIVPENSKANGKAKQ